MHLHKPAFASIALSALHLWHSDDAVPIGTNPKQAARHDRQLSYRLKPAAKGCSQRDDTSHCTKPACTAPLPQHLYMRCVLERAAAQHLTWRPYALTRALPGLVQICHGVPVLQLYVEQARLCLVRTKHLSSAAASEAHVFSVSVPKR